MKRRLLLIVVILLLAVPQGIGARPQTGAGSPADGTASEETPAVEAFVPSERLPVDTAVSFPVDI